MAKSKARVLSILSHGSHGFDGVDDQDVFLVMAEDQAYRFSEREGEEPDLTLVRGRTGTIDLEDAKKMVANARRRVLAQLAAFTKLQQEAQTILEMEQRIANWEARERAKAAPSPAS